MTETVEDFTARASAWLAEHRADAPVDYGAICPPELIEQGVAWQRRLDGAGFAGIHWPVEFGGQGLTNEHQAAWLIECAKAGVPPVLNMVGLVLAGGAIQLYGTPEQKQQHLRATLHGDHVWCQLFSEPGAGSDLGSLSTRAERDGDHFVVNGQKVWCSGGRVSNWGILMARTNPDAKKHDGISFFLCPMDLPGIEIRPLKQMTGGSEFDEVFFTDVELPADRLIGPLHGGWGVGMSVLTNERGHIGTAVITLERRLDSILELGRSRRLDAPTRQRLLRLVSQATAYKALAQRQRDQGGAVATTASSLLKLGITEMMFEFAALRATMAGSAALLDGPEALGLLAAPGGRIAGGTSQVQRNIIGERLLGLPASPRPEPVAGRLVDLSHDIADGTVTYPGLPAPVIRDHLARAHAEEVYGLGVTFQIGMITMCSNTGTYVDTPFHRFADGHDLSGLPLERVAGVPGLVVEAAAHGPIDERVLDGVDIAGRAVLVRTGHSIHFATSAYAEDHPWLTAAVAERLVDGGAACVGIDSLNIDSTADPQRPVHTILLGAGIPIVEHLTNLAELPHDRFEFTAVPPKVTGMGTFPVRAHARL